MFFKDIENWEKKKVIAYSVLFGFLVLLFCSLIPIVIIGCKYQLFTKSNYKITCAGIVCVVFLATFGIKSVKWVFSKIPETTRKWQMFKYTAEGLLYLALLGCAVWLTFLVKKNVNLAISTIQWCLYSYAVGVVIEFTCFKYVSAELDLFADAEKQKRINKKIEKI